MSGPSSKAPGFAGGYLPARVLEALLRIDFRAFVHKVFLSLTPDQDYVRNWHLDAIAYQLEHMRRGELRRLIINMPPGSLKSIMASVAFPAYTLGRDPTKRVICASYSGDLAKKHSNDFRAVLEASWYQSAFPMTRIGPYKNSENEIELTRREFRLATSVGGALAGRGGDIIVIDDPLKPDDALSETKRASANLWLTNTLLSRLDDKRTGAIIVVMQRVHLEDLSGFLLDQSDEWQLLSLPAIAEHDAVIPIGNERSYRRKAGEALSPIREPLSVLPGLKLHMGSDDFSAQYQQTPAPPGGAIVKRRWIHRYTELPPTAEHSLTLQSWDTAVKGGADNDWSVCTTWVVTKSKLWYLVDVWRGRVDHPPLKANAAFLARRWRASRVLIEDAASSASLAQELKGRSRASSRSGRSATKSAGWRLHRRSSRAAEP